MKIENCSFGQVTIEGKTFTKDLIVFPDTLFENWWRRSGHSLDVADLSPVLDRRPAIFVMGCGHSGILKVPDETRRALDDAEIELVELDTAAACEELNRLFSQGEDAAGGLHLTC